MKRDRLGVPTQSKRIRSNTAARENIFKTNFMETLVRGHQTGQRPAFRLSSSLAAAAAAAADAVSGGLLGLYT